MAKEIDRIGKYSIASGHHRFEPRIGVGLTC